MDEPSVLGPPCSRALHHPPNDGAQVCVQSSVSLQHLPLDVEREVELDAALRARLGFARQKLHEIVRVAREASAWTWPGEDLGGNAMRQRRTLPVNERALPLNCSQARAASSPPRLRVPRTRRGRTCWRPSSPSPTPCLPTRRSSPRGSTAPSRTRRGAASRCSCPPSPPPPLAPSPRRQVRAEGGVVEATAALGHNVGLPLPLPHVPLTPPP